MTRLSGIDMMFGDDLFDHRTGYVVNFSNNTFERLFAEELDVEIHSDVLARTEIRLL
ncbi:MAG TPA: hypothetical protein VGF97_13765 [Rhizomicrobium sp.]|jgi:hypothetical protein